MDRLKLPEKNCPKCKGPIHWTVVRDSFGSPSVNGSCNKCMFMFREREAPQITEGMSLEYNGKIKGTPIKNIGALDKRITSLPCDVQLGILRQRQHK